MYFVFCAARQRLLIILWLFGAICFGHTERDPPGYQSDTIARFFSPAAAIANLWKQMERIRGSASSTPLTARYFKEGVAVVNSFTHPFKANVG